MTLGIGDIVSFENPLTKKKAKRKPDHGLIVHADNDKSSLIAALMAPCNDSQSDEQDSLIIKCADLPGSEMNGNTIVYLSKLVTVDLSECRHLGQLNKDKTDKALRKLAELLTRNHFKAMHSSVTFIPGVSPIPYASRVYDQSEMINLVDASLDFWLTAGRYAGTFEKEFANYLGAKYCSLTNSGSSANLLAFMALTSPKLGKRRILPGDEVITVAAAFPTTVTPIIQYGAIPVFVDIALPTYNIDCNQLEAAFSKKTKAVMLAHTLGNPFNVGCVLQFCRKHDLWLIEDCCDALGSTYTAKNVLLPHTGEGQDEGTASGFCGTFGHLGTFSFYPAHHITMGEGGAVVTSDLSLKKLVESFRDWGRDCWCPPGKENTCGKRFSQKFGELPYGYDHKYVYSHFGYNLKLTDMQAAVGLAQLEKLPMFIESRKTNFTALYEGLKDLEDQFIFPRATPHSDPSWFGFLLTVREDAGFTRDEIVRYIEEHKIQTRMLFAGNIIKHPCFDDLRSSGFGYRVFGKLINTDIIMNRSFWVGVYPGMTETMLSFVIDKIQRFVRK